MDIDLKEVVRLLKIVDSYEAKRSEIERIYENIGIRYNIFDVLKLSTSEVRLHSSLSHHCYNQIGMEPKVVF